MSKTESKPPKNDGHSPLPPPSQRLSSELKIEKQTLRFCHNTHRAQLQGLTPTLARSPSSLRRKASGITIEIRDAGTHPHFTGNVLCSGEISALAMSTESFFLLFFAPNNRILTPKT